MSTHDEILVTWLQENGDFQAVLFKHALSPTQLRAFVADPVVIATMNAHESLLARRLRILATMHQQNAAEMLSKSMFEAGSLIECRRAAASLARLTRDMTRSASKESPSPQTAPPSPPSHPTPPSPGEHAPTSSNRSTNPPANTPNSPNETIMPRTKGLLPFVRVLEEPDVQILPTPVRRRSPINRDPYRRSPATPAINPNTPDHADGPPPHPPPRNSQKNRGR